jgi:mRNA interferase MazF
MRRGEVRWYRFEKPDKSRPVVILTRDSIIQLIGEVTVAPITSTVRDIPSEVLLDKTDGMSRQCAVNCDHIQTVPKARLGALITTLSLPRLREVRDAVDFALGLRE